MSITGNPKWNKGSQEIYFERNPELSPVETPLEADGAHTDGGDEGRGPLEDAVVGQREEPHGLALQHGGGGGHHLVKDSFCLSDQLTRVHSSGLWPPLLSFSTGSCRHWTESWPGLVWLARGGAGRTGWRQKFSFRSLEQRNKELVLTVILSIGNKETKFYMSIFIFKFH